MNTDPREPCKLTHHREPTTRSLTGGTDMNLRTKSDININIFQNYKLPY